jgi:hypothetical protein
MMAVIWIPPGCRSVPRRTGSRGPFSQSGVAALDAETANRRVVRGVFLGNLREQLMRFAGEMPTLRIEIVAREDVIRAAAVRRFQLGSDERRRRDDPHRLAGEHIG